VVPIHGTMIGVNYFCRPAKVIVADHTHSRGWSDVWSEPELRLDPLRFVLERIGAALERAARGGERGERGRVVPRDRTLEALQHLDALPEHPEHALVIVDTARRRRDRLRTRGAGPRDVDQVIEPGRVTVHARGEELVREPSCSI
jgi:hypothetical protein